MSGGRRFSKRRRRRKTKRKGRNLVAVSSYGGREDPKIRRQQKTPASSDIFPLLTEYIYCQKEIESS
jgi:hypothetical protein